MRTRSHVFKSAFAATTLIACAPAWSADPGRGLTAPLERAYLELTIDHEYAGLRMTELAAGTDATRDADLLPAEGTAPTPGTRPTAAKATLAAVTSLARLNNRKQRELILMAQTMLSELYGVTHAPTIRPHDRVAIDELENEQAGRGFDRKFLEVFARHHYLGVAAALRCNVGADPAHVELKAFCRNALENELQEIELMRLHLCKNFGDCDYQPLADPRGRSHRNPVQEEADPPLTTQ